MSDPDSARSVVGAVAGKEPPEALRAPTASVGRRFLIMFGLAAFALQITYSPVFNILLPTQISRINPDNAETNLAIVTTIGTVLGGTASIAVGLLSDRTTSRLGRRRPWIIAGIAGTVVGVAILANAPGLVALVVGWSLVEIFTGASNTAFVTIMPDTVPERQRGAISVLVSAAPTLAILVGAVLVGFVFTGIRTGYYAVAVIGAVMVAAFVLTYREVRLPKESRPPLALRRSLASLWVSPRRHPDFALAWVTRLLLTVGIGMGTGGFLLLYLKDVVGYANPTQGAAILQAVSVPTLILGAVLSGVLSDRLGRRKVFVVGACVAIAAALALVGLVHAWPAVLVAAVVLNFGSGMFVAVDIPLMLATLPSAENRGKDVGLLLIVQTLAGAISAPVAALIVNNVEGVSSTAVAYTVLYVSAATVCLLAAVLVQRIRGVS